MEFPDLSSDDEHGAHANTLSTAPPNGSTPSPAKAPASHVQEAGRQSDPPTELPVSSSGAAGSPPGTPGAQGPPSLLHSCVRLVDTGLRFNAAGSLFYDDVAGVLHDVVRGAESDVLYSYSVLSSAMRRKDVVRGRSCGVGVGGWAGVLRHMIGCVGFCVYTVYCNGGDGMMRLVMSLYSVVHFASHIIQCGGHS